MSDPYVYPGTRVLKNKFNLQDSAALRNEERVWVLQRMSEGLPKGDFDLAHLQSIHRHILQDVYEWAGELRTTTLHKDGTEFMFHGNIPRAMNYVHKQVKDARYFKGSGRNGFSSAAAEIIGQVNHIHPFRDGNGRTQLLYLEQLAANAGHMVDLTKLERHSWINASIKADDKDYSYMAGCIRSALVERNLSKTRPQNPVDDLDRQLDRAARLEKISRPREPDDRDR